MDPDYGRLAGSGSVWRDTDPDPGHINVQNNAMAKEFCVNKFINVDFFHQLKFLFSFKAKHFLVFGSDPGSGWRILATWIRIRIINHTDPHHCIKQKNIY